MTGQEYLNRDLGKLKELYAKNPDLWAKAADQCGRLIKRILKQNLGVTIRPGHGALSDKWVAEGHDPGEPDIFVIYKDEIFAGIEVTGSLEVTPYKGFNIWIGKHKVDYARKAKFPIAFFLYYAGNVQRFIPAQLVINRAPEAELVYIRGFPEYMHKVPYGFSRPGNVVFEWLRIQKRVHDFVGSE